MDNVFQVGLKHKQWARRANSKYGKGVEFWESLIRERGGKCALTGAPLLFDRKYGTPPCHPLYASVDHVSPGREDCGLQIVCYDINDLKGHLPMTLFEALKKTDAWKSFKRTWEKEAKRTRSRAVFKWLIKSDTSAHKDVTQ